MLVKISFSFRIVFNLHPSDETRIALERTLKLMLRSVQSMENIQGYLDLCFERKFEYVHGEWLKRFCVVGIKNVTDYWSKI